MGKRPVTGITLMLNLSSESGPQSAIRGPSNLMSALAQNLLFISLSFGAKKMAIAKQLRVSEAKHL
jgi:hypothetical protein